MTRTVVVSGASSGIGEACAIEMARRGWRVFAGVRRDADGAALRTKADLTPILLDVTDAQSIAAAAKTVADAAGAEGLDGLVNNAGIGIGAPLEFLPIDDLRRQLEVNVVGLVAVTQAFLPLIRKARGRIVHMGSIGGSLAVPFAGAYSASKFALEAITDAMRMELAPWNIGVSLIKPAAVATPIWEKGRQDFDAMLKRMPAQIHDLYGDAIQRALQLAGEEDRSGIAPAKVAECVAHALTAAHPKTRYVVGKQAGTRVAIGRLAPDRLRDRIVFRQTGLPGPGSAR